MYWCGLASAFSCVSLLLAYFSRPMAFSGSAVGADGYTGPAPLSRLVARHSTSSAETAGSESTDMAWAG